GLVDQHVRALAGSGQQLGAVAVAADDKAPGRAAVVQVVIAAQQAALVLHIKATRHLAPNRATGTAIAPQTVAGAVRIRTGLGEAEAVAGYTMGEGGGLHPHL